MPVDIIINVYDLADNFFSFLGAYHSGVEIGGVEYSFAADAGIYTCQPRQAYGAKFRESIVVGTTSLTTADVRARIESLRPDFRGDSYNLLQKNCNHFADRVVKTCLGDEKGIPSYINRLASLGRACSCLLPSSLKNHGGPASNANALGTRTTVTRTITTRAPSTTTPFGGKSYSLGISSVSTAAPTASAVGTSPAKKSTADAEREARAAAMAARLASQP